MPGEIRSNGLTTLREDRYGKQYLSAQTLVKSS